MLKTKLGLERLEDRDAPSGVTPGDGSDPGTPPPPPGDPVPTLQPGTGH